MSKDQETQQTFERILKEGSFHELKAFTTEKALKSLNAEERDSLSRLLILYGEKQYNEGDQNAFKTFTWATKASPKRDDFYFAIATIVSRSRTHVYSLNLAAEYLQKAIAINSEDCRYWHTLADVTTVLGINKGCMEHLSSAQEYFAKALEKCPPEEVILYNNILWMSGMCYNEQGNFSGEALDYKKAIEKFQKARDRGFKLDHPNILNEFGIAYFKLSLLVGNFDFLLEAKCLFEKANEIDPKLFSTLSYLGSCHQLVYETYLDQEAFDKANATFEQAIAIAPDSALIWAKWAKLYAIKGKINSCTDMLYLSSERYEKANTLEPENLIFLTSWVEALIIYGALTDQLRYLQEAEKKILQGMDLDSNNHRLWYLYGTCFNELGNYFDEESFFHKAIEKLQFALTLKHDDANSWHSLALSYYRIGEMQENLSILEHSLKLFCRVLEFGKDMHPQFWNDWGVVYMQIGEIDPQRHYYESAIEKFKNCVFQDFVQPDVEWLYNYGCSLQSLADTYGDMHFEQAVTLYEEALEVLSTVITKAPSAKGARFNIAETFCQLGRHTNNVDYLQRSLENYEFLIHMDHEDEYSWNSYGMTYLYLAELIEDETNAAEVARLYELAENKFSQAVSLGCTEAFYNLACLYSITQRYDIAMFYMEKAEQNDALPPLEDIIHDDWLEGLRNTDAFNAFIKEIDLEDKS